MKTNTRKKGSLLIEAVVSLAAIIITVAAISIVVTLSVSNTGFIKDQNKASKYAQEGMEYLRSQARDNYASFLTTYLPSGNQNSYCLGSGINSFDAFTPARIPPCTNADDKLDDGKFQREVLVQDDSIGTECTGGVRVTVTVRWQSGKCDPAAGTAYCHNSTLVSCFSDTSSSP